jgi:hypothetical protein
MRISLIKDTDLPQRTQRFIEDTNFTDDWVAPSDC